ncbi:hypothetical protein CLU79DRAFT_331388 [Phycomyces nitens]|nr:hypothetical protein CLU79DRAFT_331388 [Phycomyces nitens]
MLPLNIIFPLLSIAFFLISYVFMPNNLSLHYQGVPASKLWNSIRAKTHSPSLHSSAFKSESISTIVMALYTQGQPSPTAMITPSVIEPSIEPNANRKIVTKTAQYKGHYISYVTKYDQSIEPKTISKHVSNQSTITITKYIDTEYTTTRTVYRGSQEITSVASDESKSKQNPTTVFLLSSPVITPTGYDTGIAQTEYITIKDILTIKTLQHCLYRCRAGCGHNSAPQSVHCSGAIYVMLANTRSTYRSIDQEILLCAWCKYNNHKHHYYWLIICNQTHCSILQKTIRKIQSTPIVTYTFGRTYK